MSSGESLDVIVRIPVGVIDNNCVSCCQVDTETSSPVESQTMNEINKYIPHTETCEMWLNEDQLDQSCKK
jgi:hypothetical protein